MSSYNSPTNTTPNFDNLLLQSLLNRLNLRPSTTAAAAPSFDDFLSDHLSSLYSSDDDDNDNDDDDYGGVPSKTQLAKEEAKLEKEIIKVILSGKTDALKPNSGQAVSIGEHYVCVGFHEEEGGSEYRVWEWHGHVMLFDDDHGYTPEYIYGNYFERLVSGGSRNNSAVNNKKMKKKDAVVEDEEKEKAKEENSGGLKDLIMGLDSDKSRVLHRPRNPTTPRVPTGSSESEAVAIQPKGALEEKSS